MGKRKIVLLCFLVFIVGFLLFAACENIEGNLQGQSFDSSGGDISSSNEFVSTGADQLEFNYNEDTDTYSAVISKFVKSTKVILPEEYDGKSISNVIVSTVDNNLIYNEYKDFLYLGSKNNPYFALIKAKSMDIEECTIHEATKVIADEALSAHRFTSIVIPANVTYIGKRVFCDCHNLASLTFEEESKLICIGESAFAHHCLNSVTIPGNVENIGSNAFYTNSDCLQTVIINNNNSLTNVGRDPFGRNVKILQASIEAIDIIIKQIESYSISLIVTSGEIIKERMFDGCNKINSVMIGGSIKCIEFKAFSNCNNLISVEFMDDSQLTTIGQEAFYCCLNLASITLPNSVVEIGQGAFENCCGLTSFDFENESKLIRIRKGAFYNCSNLQSVTLPNSVAYIEGGAFADCANLVSFTLSDGIIDMGGTLFYGCNKLKYNEYNNGYYLGSSTNEQIAFIKPKEKTIKTFTIPQSTIIICDNAFEDCTKLTDIIIPLCIKQIGNDAFRGCSGLTSITIPNNVKIIGSGVFSGCSALSEIILPDHLSEINSRMFYGCSSLTEFTISDEVTKIGSSAFSGCSALASIIIPDGMAEIEASAFSGCSSLSSIVIPKNIITINNGLFSDCANLESVIFAEDSLLSAIATRCFWECGSLKSIDIPDGVTIISGAAFNNCSSLVSISIPKSVQQLSGLSGCISLKAINYNGTIAQWNAIEKVKTWDYNTDSYTIYCIDGEITKQ